MFTRRGNGCQHEEQEWDTEDNSRQDLMNWSDGRLVVNTPDHLTLHNVNIGSSGVFPEGARAGDIIRVDGNGQYWMDQMANIDYCTEFALRDGSSTKISLIEDRSALSIDIDVEMYEPVIEDGQIIIRRMFDEENNASQDNRTHEQAAEDNPHSSQNVLLGGNSGTITFTA